MNDFGWAVYMLGVLAHAGIVFALMAWISDRPRTIEETIGGISIAVMWPFFDPIFAACIGGLATVAAVAVASTGGRILLVKCGMWCIRSMFKKREVSDAD